MYFITTLQLENKGIVRYRTVGYFKDYEKAFDILSHNIFDLYECGYYNHAVIEKIDEGLYQYDSEPKWFKWDETLNGYAECDVPEGMLNYACFAQIG